MKRDLERRVAALEAGQGHTDAIDDPDLELTRIMVGAYYNDLEPQLTPEQEQMLKDTEKWFQNGGLWDFYFGPDEEPTQ